MAERIIALVAMPSDKETEIRMATAQKMLVAVEKLAVHAERLDRDAERLDRDAESHGHDAKFWSARAKDEEVISSAEGLLGLGGMQMTQRCKVDPYGRIEDCYHVKSRGEVAQEDKALSEEKQALKAKEQALEAKEQAHEARVAMAHLLLDAGIQFEKSKSLDSAEGAVSRAEALGVSLPRALVAKMAALRARITEAKSAAPKLESRPVETGADSALRMGPHRVGALSAGASQTEPTPAANGKSRYVATGGTVHDTRTQLTWQRTVSSTAYIWADAKTYCAGLGTSLGGTGWRLPTLDELKTIVDDSQVNPSIDSTVFPSTPPNRFWSSSPLAGSSSRAWVVVFNIGLASNNDVSYQNSVRCVR
jgi:hypothetical protein